MRSSIPLAVAVTVACGAARADEASEPPAIRVTATGAASFSSYARPEERAGGVALGGELRVHPDSMHGVFVAGEMGGGLFGPTVTTFDVGYSLRPLAPKHLEGLTGSIYLDVGPSLGLVWVPEGFHHDLGGRVGVEADVELGWFVIGAGVTVSAGLPVDGQGRDGWESSVVGGARVGLALDFGG